jgi:hypothetical protein
LFLFRKLSFGQSGVLLLGDPFEQHRSRLHKLEPPSFKNGARYFAFTSVLNL